MIMFHPSRRDLERFASREGDSTEALRKHLTSCQRCRDMVQLQRDVADALRDDAADSHPLADENLERAIMQRLHDGERLVLPVEPTLHPASRTPHTAILAAAAIVSIAIMLSLVSGGEQVTAGATRGELRFDAPGLGLGRVIVVNYNAPPQLADASRLYLRARYRGAEASSYNRQIRPVIAAELRRVGPSEFRGTLQVPDSVVYAAFAVEDSGAATVDHNEQRLWHLLRHDANGKPTYAALGQRWRDLMGVNWELVFETIRQQAAAYPDDPEVWSRVAWAERLVLGEAHADSVRPSHRARLHALHTRYAAGGRVPREIAEGLAGYATDVNDGTDPEDATIGSFWRARMRADSSPHRHVFEAMAAVRVDSARGAHLYEEAWSRSGHRVSFMANNAWVLALRRGDTAGMLRWADRIALVEEFPSRYLQLLDFPTLRPTAMNRIRKLAAGLGSGTALIRPLEVPISVHRRSERELRGYLLGVLGDALVADGDLHGGTDTLELGTRLVWHAPLFAKAARAHLLAGDTTRALPHIARVLIDPASDDSIVASFAAFRTPPFDTRIAMLLDRERTAMHQKVLETAVNRHIGTVGMLRRSDGRQMSLNEARGGRPAVVTFWSRLNGPWRHEIPGLAALATQLDSVGVALVVVSKDPPSAELRAYLASAEISMPVYHDVRAEARRAFEQYATPEYHVVDAEGRLRFTRTSRQRLLAQAMALVHTPSRQAVAAAHTRAQASAP